MPHNNGTLPRNQRTVSHPSASGPCPEPVWTRAIAGSGQTIRIPQILGGNADSHLEHVADWILPICWHGDDVQDHEFADMMAVLQTQQAEQQVGGPTAS